MSTTEEPAELAEPAEREDSTTPEAARRRRGLVVAAVLLLACGAFGAYAMLGSDETSTPGQGAPARAGAAADVTYEVLGEGTADISYRGPGEEGTTVVANASLPWKKTVRVPVGAAPSVHVTLGEKGGTASCTLAVQGRHIQRATATGAFGRTTCSGEPSVPAAAEGAQ